MSLDSPNIAALLAQFAPADLHSLGWPGAVAVLGGGMAAAAKMIAPIWREAIAQRREAAKAKHDLEQAEHKAREDRRRQEREELQAIIHATRELPSRLDQMSNAIRDGFAATAKAIDDLRDELRSETADRMREMHAAIVGPRSIETPPSTPLPVPPRARLASRPQEHVPPR